MPPSSTSSALRRTWISILVALAFGALMYGLLAFFIEHGKAPRVVSASLPTMRIMMTLFAVAELGASVAWLQFATQGKMSDSGGTILTPGEFQTQSIIAMALAEACSISGLLLFFMGNTLRQFMPFIAGTLAVFFLFILPKGLRYYAAWEKSQRPKPPSPFG